MGAGLALAVSRRMEGITSNNLWTSLFTNCEFGEIIEIAHNHVISVPKQRHVY
jgi:hypothetical protein